MKRVYIAGPITKGDLLNNVQQADKAFADLVKAGFAPFNPMWSVYGGAVFRDSGGNVMAEATRNSKLELTHEDWLGIDLPWVEMADAVLRLPGESAGADRETAHATANCIPVFKSINVLVDYFGELPDPEIRWELQ